MDTLQLILGISGGLAFIAAVLQDAFEVMLLPRHVRRKWRLVRFYFDHAWQFWRWIGVRRKSAEERERFLSLFGPISMVVLFTIWAVCLLCGFALLFWSVERSLPHARPFGDYLYMSGVTLLTLGYGDMTPQTGMSKAIAVFEAATGYGMLAVVISYLPVLYQLFSGRERSVIQLDGRAGSPPTACVLLFRHIEGGEIEKLETLLREWELWSAEIVESHISYPMLTFYRSQHENQNWLAGLTAIMDSCVLIMVGLRDVPSFQAKMTFAMARLALVDLCAVLGLSVATKARGRLNAEDFGRICEKFSDADIDFIGSDNVSAQIGEFQRTYEPFLFCLADYLVVDLPRFIPPKNKTEALDNWQKSTRGRVAKNLVEKVTS